MALPGPCWGVGCSWYFWSVMSPMKRLPFAPPKLTNRLRSSRPLSKGLKKKERKEDEKEGEEENGVKRVKEEVDREIE